MQKRLKIALLSSLMFVFIMLTSCGKNMQDEHGKLNVVTTFYPLYFFAKEIGGEQAVVTNLISAGVEPHEWTPKSGDLKAAENSDLFIYNGAGFEAWVPDFLDGLTSSKNLALVEASKGILRLQASGLSDDAEDSEQGHKEGHEGHGKVDPHTFVSPRSMLTMVKNIHHAFIKADPKHEEDYTHRYQKIKQRLQQLDQKYASQLKKTKRREIVVSHQAFSYLARDYHFKQFSVMGLSPEAEPRAQDLKKLTQLVKEYHIPYICFEELVSPAIAKTLAEEGKVKVLVLNPMEGLTKEQERNGVDYFMLMEQNLTHLLKALND